MKTINNRLTLVLVTILAVVAGGEAGLLYRAHQERVYSQGGYPVSCSPLTSPAQNTQPVGMFAMNRAFAPQLDLKDTGKACIITAALPGFKKSDLNVSVDGRMLNVSGNSAGTHRFSWFGHPKQNDYEHFQSSIALPQGVEPSRMDATYKHGVLKITVPKEEPENAARKVVVQ